MSYILHTVYWVILMLGIFSRYIYFFLINIFVIFWCITYMDSNFGTFVFDKLSSFPKKANITKIT